MLVMVQGILAFMLCNPNFTFLTRYQYINIVGIRLFLSGYRLLPESDKSHELFLEKWPTQNSRRVFCLFVCLICLHQGLVAACGIFVALYAVGWAPEDVGSVAVAPELRKS